MTGENQLSIPIRFLKIKQVISCAPEGSAVLTPPVALVNFIYQTTDPLLTKFRSVDMLFMVKLLISCRLVNKHG